MTRTKTLLALSLAIPAMAQSGAARHHQYKLIEVGTFGGPDSTYDGGPGGSILRYLNHHGAAAGVAATSVTDPFAPNCWYDCYVDHALSFKYDILTDLGALPGSGNSSAASGINDRGWIVGQSENGQIDPMTGYPEYHAVVWKDGSLIDLGTFGGNESQAFQANNAGQVVGVAANTVQDPYSSGYSSFALGPYTAWFGAGVATEQRAFLWEGGALQDLGTLGGNDAAAYLINERGQIAGVSYTSTIPNASTGYPTQDPFLWDHGTMIDLGGLGGTNGTAYCLNNGGQVAGISNLAGDQYTHAFLWDRGTLIDLGTLGGDMSHAYGCNDAGDVVGAAEQPGDQEHHAALWRHGAVTDLGTLSGDNFAIGFSINARGQIVGCSGSFQTTCYQAAFLWENSGPMVDLNTLVKSNPSNLQLQAALNVADNGEILVYATLPNNGGVRLALLVPDGD
jgi:probable HAF family extracellular repeat protein